MEFREDQPLWVEKYRPQRIADCILSQELKDTFQSFVDKKMVPNIILAGDPGVGKTTVARALCNEVESDYIFINGSKNGNIDTLRNEITNFASSVSFSGNRKTVILDEGDYLNQQSTQPALRAFTEEFSRNCSFIITCNYKARIIPPLRDRFSEIDFKAPKGEEKAKLALQFFKRVCAILENEAVEYDKSVVADLITEHFPSCRRVLHELQKYASKNGKIDIGILARHRDADFDELIENLKKKSFSGVRKWVGENSDVEYHVIFTKLWDYSEEGMTPQSAAELVTILSRYQSWAPLAANPSINIMGCLTEIMGLCEFK